LMATCGVSVLVLFAGAGVLHRFGLSGESFEWALYVALGIASPMLCVALFWRREGPNRTDPRIRFALAFVFLIAVCLRFMDALFSVALFAVAQGALVYRTVARRERIWAALLLLAAWVISSKLFWWTTLDRWLLDESPGSIVVG